MPRILFLIVSLIMALTSPASVPAGEWRLHTPFSGADRVLATPEGYFFTSRGFLFFHSPDRQETIPFNTAGGLTGTKVEHIFYNHHSRYTAAVYTDGNIDIIDRDGRVSNLSDIRDAEISGSHRVRYLTFGPGRIYAACDFGTVIFDDRKMQVAESGIFNTPVDLFLKSGDRYLINTGGEWRSLPDSERINRLDRFTPIGNAAAFAAADLGDGRVIASGPDGVKIYSFDFAECNLASKQISTITPRYIDPDGNGGWQFSADGRITAIDASGEKTLDCKTETTAAAYFGDASRLAGATPAGLLPLEKSGDAIRPAGQPVAPGDIAVRNVDRMVFDADGTLYLKSIAPSRLFTNLAYGPTTIDRILPDGTVEHLEPVDAEYPKDPDGEFWNDDCLTNSLGITLHPTGKGVFYTGNFVRGLYMHRDNRIIAHADNSNSPLRKWWGTTVQDGAFDASGNLWLLCNFRGEPLYRINAGSVMTLDRDSWEKIDIQGFDTGHDAQIVYCRKSRTLVAVNTTADHPTLFYDTRGTDSTGDDIYSAVKDFHDRDGVTLSYQWRTCAAEDRDGKMWIGTDNGIIVVPDPAEMAADPYVPVIRPKVARNDGTGLADYLLANITVSCIAVDGANRKWIGTLTDGLYLVSPDGTEIISRFTPDNSPLPSPAIHSVACHPTDSRVMIGTALGLLEYGGSATEPANDFKTVTAYPNPVHPGSNTNVTVSGLMSDTLVKITNASGALVATVRSEGGMAVWNCCDMSGRRVQAGVYYVFLSGGTADSGNSRGAVTKILVIN